MADAFFNLSELDGTSGFALNGSGFARSGFSVSGAGDFNGDGFDDVIIGSRLEQSYVVFGSDAGFPAEIELSTLDGTNGFAINGIEQGAELRTVSMAGDVNGDGFDDVIIGSPDATPSGTLSGQSYVVFGSNTGFPAEIELSALDGTNGFIINSIGGGQIPGDQLGFSLSDAGDVNGDGFDDIIVGSLADINGSLSGQSYVVFGSDAGFPAQLELSALNGTNGFAINGINPNDFAGEVSNAGDVNDDGIDDIIIGAYGNIGQSYVVFGSDAGFPAQLELSALNGTNGFTLNGFDVRTGYSVSGAGDINGDGIDDLIIGASSASPSGNASGQSYVVFGSDTGFPAQLELSALDGTNGFMLDGINAGDGLGEAVSSAGDFNGDGFDDLIVSGVGQSYLVFGSDAGFPAKLDLSALDGTNGFAINSGFRQNLDVSDAGDVNGDGFDDLIIGARNALGGDGQSYVIFGFSTGNEPPIAIDDGTTTAQDTAVDIKVLANDSDPDGDDLAIESFTQGANGSVTLNDNGTPGNATDDFLVYTPDTGVNGLQDTFTYTISDGTDTDTATVTVEIGTTFTGTNQSDDLSGTPGDDYIDGGNSDDIIGGLGGNDTLIGGNGSDSIYGGDGDDLILGGENNDTGGGKDVLFGGAGDDTILGGNGKDDITGGLGDDSLTGGNASDTFIFAEGDGTDTITDYEVGLDLIGLSGGLTFNDLVFSGNDIILTSINETLATLTGVDTTTLTSGDFVIV